MIKVLVVEDSPTMRALLVQVLSSDPAISVIGTANNGKEALRFLQSMVPDVIIMDVHMPHMDGLEAVRVIMQTRPVPIIVVSASWAIDEVEMTFLAMEAGAVAVATKPRGIGHPDHDAVARHLVQTVKTMSEVKLVRRWQSNVRDNRGGRVAVAESQPDDVAGIKLVAMGSSTGGPPVLQTILAGLPEVFPAPLLIVQHITPGFLQGLVDWLSQTTKLRLHIAAHGELPLPGHVYFAPDGLHLGVDRGGRIELSADESENGMRPSISYLFRSVAQVLGRQAVGVLLSGMGRDGAQELKLLKEAGAVTIVQDKESAAVYGMAGEAIRLNAVSHVLSPSAIAETLLKLSEKCR